MKVSARASSVNTSYHVAERIVACLIVPTTESSFVLVVGRPDHDRRMVAQSAHLVTDLFGHRIQEGRVTLQTHTNTITRTTGGHRVSYARNRKAQLLKRTYRIHGTRKHELLPHHQTKLITHLIQWLVLVDPSTPHADDIHVGIDCTLKESSQHGRIDTALERIGRNLHNSHSHAWSTHTPRSAAAASGDTIPNWHPWRRWAGC